MTNERTSTLEPENLAKTGQADYDEGNFYFRNDEYYNITKEVTLERKKDRPILH